MDFFSGASPRVSVPFLCSTLRWCLKTEPITNINDLNSIEQTKQFLADGQAVAFLVASRKDEYYRGIQRTLVKFRYASLNKRSKGVGVRFLTEITCCWRQHTTDSAMMNAQLGREGSSTLLFDMIIA